MALIDIDTFVIDRLKAAKRLRSINSLSKKVKIKPATLSEYIKNKKGVEENVLKLVNHFNPDREKQLALDVVCNHYKIQIQDIAKRQNVEARQVATYLTFRQGGKSKKQIARDMGYKDHTGVNVALEAISNRWQTEPDMRKMIDELENLIH